MTAMVTEPMTDTGELNPEAIRSRRLLMLAALGTVYVAWGSTYLAVKVMVGQMPALLGFRYPRACGWRTASSRPDDHRGPEPAAGDPLAVRRMCA